MPRRETPWRARIAISFFAWCVTLGTLSDSRRARSASGKEAPPAPNNGGAGEAIPAAATGSGVGSSKREGVWGRPPSPPTPLPLMGEGRRGVPPLADWLDVFA